jgi:hypothetical protein
MGRVFQPARNPGAGVAAPSIISGAYTTGQTFKKGAVLVQTAAGTLSEAGADPSADIAGVALEGAGTKPGYDMANSDQILQVTGRVQEVSYAKAKSGTVFSGRGINGGTDPVTPAQTNIHEQYGIAKTAAGEWVIDLAEVTTKSIEIVDIDIEQKIFFFVFIESVLAA